MAIPPLFTLAMITDSNGNTFLIDVCLNDTHEFRSQITSDPIEDGSTLTDNIINEPVDVSMECLVSNAPINSDIIDARSGETSPANEAYQFLMKCRDDREPISVRTSLDTFDSMGIEHISIPRTAGRGDELRWSMTLKKMVIVTNIVTTRTATPQSKGSNTKKKPVVPVDNSKFIRIIPQNNQWLDININAWRLGATRGTGGVPFLQGDNTSPFGSWVCSRGVPDGVFAEDWLLADDAGKTAIEQQVLLAHPSSYAIDSFTEAGLPNAIAVPRFQVTFTGSLV